MAGVLHEPAASAGFLDSLGRAVCHSFASKHVPAATIEGLRTLFPEATSLSLQVVLSHTVILSVDGLLSPGECSVSFVTSSDCTSATCIRNASLVSIARPKDRDDVEYLTFAPLFWHYNWRKLLDKIQGADVTWQSVCEFLDVYTTAAAFPCLGCITLGCTSQDNCLRLLTLLRLTVAVSASLPYESQAFLEDMAYSAGITGPDHAQEYVAGEGFVTLSASDWEGPIESDDDDSSCFDEQTESSGSERSRGAPCKDICRKEEYDTDDEFNPSQSLPSSSGSCDEAAVDAKDSLGLYDSPFKSKRNDAVVGSTSNALGEEPLVDVTDDFTATDKPSESDTLETLRANQNKLLLFYYPQDLERVYVEHVSDRTSLTDRTCAVLVFLLFLATVLPLALSWNVSSSLPGWMLWAFPLLSLTFVWMTRKTWFSRCRESVYMLLFVLLWLLPYLSPEPTCTFVPTSPGSFIISHNMLYLVGTLVAQIRLFNYVPLLLLLATLQSMAMAADDCAVWFPGSSLSKCHISLFAHLAMYAILPCAALAWLLDWRSRKQFGKLATTRKSINPRRTNSSDIAVKGEADADN